MTGALREAGLGSGAGGRGSTPRPVTTPQEARSTARCTHAAMRGAEPLAALGQMWRARSAVAGARRYHPHCSGTRAQPSLLDAEDARRPCGAAVLLARVGRPDGSVDVHLVAWRERGCARRPSPRAARRAGKATGRGRVDAGRLARAGRPRRWRGARRGRLLGERALERFVVLALGGGAPLAAHLLGELGVALIRWLQQAGSSRA